MSRWRDRHDVPRGDAYDARWKRLEAAGESIHGEADLIHWLGATCVLDAGCGTGRVAIELARRGMEVVGVDLDPVMLVEALRKAAEIEWIEADLLDVTVGETPRGFDVVAMAGNVMIFVTPGTERQVVANMARHLRPGGLLVAGFQLQLGRYDLDAYDADCASVDLTILHRWATWDRQPFDGGDYAVSVHQLDDATGD